MKTSLRLITLFAVIGTTKAEAGRVSALIGPPSLGQGGSNPVSVPPFNAIDWQVHYVTDHDTEFMVSVIPGFFLGKRWRKDQLSIGFAGGMLISTNGLGVGLSQSLSWESQPFWTNWRFEAEYRQVIGYTVLGAEFPYAIRLGINYEI
ncbi:MAG: hypothetical protein EOP10_17265 [Proteobacteria bacterium]|nr:MAG: hypothetical protein EOP10_17265 [Pseudomonadota bacterium]